MYFTISEFFTINKYFIYVVFTDYTISKTFGAGLFIWTLLLKKPEDQVFAFKILVPVFYFLFINIGMFFRYFHSMFNTEEFSFFYWYVMAFISSWLLFKFVERFQGRKKVYKRKKKPKNQIGKQI